MTFLNKKMMWRERKLAKMLCFEAHQNQSLGEGAAQKTVKEQIQDSMLTAVLEHCEKKSYST